MFSSDEEALEAVKSWWKDNGAFIIAGLVIGVALIAGWRFWLWSVETEAREASGLYTQLTVAADTGNREQVGELSEQLRGNYRRSPYASHGALIDAAYSVEQGETEAAVDSLQWVVDNTRDAELESVARSRLARVYIDIGEAEQALAVLDVAEVGRFGPLFDELRGDALLASGDPAAAREAYGRALDSDNEGFTARGELEMKYHDLAGHQD